MHALDPACCIICHAAGLIATGLTRRSVGLAQRPAQQRIGSDTAPRVHRRDRWAAIASAPVSGTYSNPGISRGRRVSAARLARSSGAHGRVCGVAGRRTFLRGRLIDPRQGIPEANHTEDDKRREDYRAFQAIYPGLLRGSEPIAPLDQIIDGLYAFFLRAFGFLLFRYVAARDRHSSLP